MLIVDTNIWIDYFNNTHTQQTEILESLLGNELLGTGDIILLEVLQGFRKDAEFRIARNYFQSLRIFDMLGAARVLPYVDRYRWLRKNGITVRRSTDLIIASYCIDEGHTLLFSDRDFLPFVKHLGLKTL